ncbi:hypothetical protein EIP91_009969 [Steccherinum ochraceum]|uniref:CCHC-type domain-containing protein n=1 Tax=Steccherinum ochraceum TaxID=92696 RepID=A0A4R0RDF4_9APHY|nr:hypothetical protein EIP91_009969 [Steccherinum ochraceum]
MPSTTSSRGSHHMPMPEARTAPHKFRGKASTLASFLLQFESLANTQGLSAEERCRWIIEYCSTKVRNTIRGFTNYHAGDWEGLKKDIESAYDIARDTQRYDLATLIHLCRKSSGEKKRRLTSLNAWKIYVRDYVRIAGSLLQQHQITKHDYEVYFWIGIPATFQTRLEIIIRNRLPNHDISKPYPVSEVQRAAEDLLHRNRFDKSRVIWLDKSDESSEDDSSSDSDDEDSDDEEDVKTYVKKLLKKNSHKSKSSRSKDKESIELAQKALADIPSLAIPKETPKTRSKHSSTNKGAAQNDVEGLITKMSKMSIQDPQYALLYYQAVKLDPLAANCLASPLSRPYQQTMQPARSNVLMSEPMPPTPQMNPVNSMNGMPRRRFPPPMNNNGNRCYGCDEEGHRIAECPTLNSLLDRKLIQRDRIGRFLTPQGVRITRSPSESWVQAFNRMTPQSNFITVTSDVEESEFDSDSEQEFATAVYGTRSKGDAPPPSAEAPARKPPSQRAPPRAKSATPVDAIPSRFDPTREDIIMEDLTSQAPAPKQPPKPQQRKVEVVPKPANKPAAPPVTPNPTTSAADKDKKDERRRKSAVSNTVIPAQVVDKLLSTPIHLSIGEVLGVSREISQELQDKLRYKKAEAFSPTQASSNFTNTTRDTTRAMLIRLPLHCNERAFPMDFVVDTGSEINVVSTAVWKKLRVPLDRKAAITLKDANGGLLRLDGLIRNIRLQYGEIETFADFYVSSKAPFAGLLGLPWMSQNSISVKMDPTGEVEIRFCEKPEEIVILPGLVDKDEEEAEYDYGQTYMAQIVDMEDVQPTIQASDSIIVPFTGTMPVIEGTPVVDTTIDDDNDSGSSAYEPTVDWTEVDRPAYPVLQVTRFNTIQPVNVQIQPWKERNDTEESAPYIAPTSSYIHIPDSVINGFSTGFNFNPRSPVSFLSTKAAQFMDIHYDAFPLSQLRLPDDDHVYDVRGISKDIVITCGTKFADKRESCYIADNVYEFVVGNRFVQALGIEPEDGKFDPVKVQKAFKVGRYEPDLDPPNISEWRLQPGQLPIARRLGGRINAEVILDPHFKDNIMSFRIYKALGLDARWRDIYHGGYIKTERKMSFNMAAYTRSLPIKSRIGILRPEVAVVFQNWPDLLIGSATLEELGMFKEGDPEKILKHLDIEVLSPDLTGKYDDVLDSSDEEMEATTHLRRFPDIHATGTESPMEDIDIIVDTRPSNPGTGQQEANDILEHLSKYIRRKGEVFPMLAEYYDPTGHAPRMGSASLAIPEMQLLLDEFAQTAGLHGRAFLLHNATLKFGGQQHWKGPAVLHMFPPTRSLEIATRMASTTQPARPVDDVPHANIAVVHEPSDILEHILPILESKPAPFMQWTREAWIPPEPLPRTRRTLVRYPLFKMNGVVHGIDTPFVLDTGSEVNMIRGEVWDEMVKRRKHSLDPLPELVSSPDSYVASLVGFQHLIRGVAMGVKIEVGPIKTWSTLYVMDNLYNEAAFGMAWIVDNEVSFGQTAQGLTIRITDPGRGLTYDIAQLNGLYNLGTLSLADVTVPSASFAELVTAPRTENTQPQAADSDEDTESETEATGPPNGVINHDGWPEIGRTFWDEAEEEEESSGEEDNPIEYGLTPAEYEQFNQWRERARTDGPHPTPQISVRYRGLSGAPGRLQYVPVQSWSFTRVELADFIPDWSESGTASYRTASIVGFINDRPVRIQGFVIDPLSPVSPDDPDTDSEMDQPEEEGPVTVENEEPRSAFAQSVGEEYGIGTEEVTERTPLILSVA